MTSAKPIVSPRIPKYRLHKPTGLSVVRLSGRDVYLGKHGSPASRTAYRKAVAEWLASAKQEPVGPRSHAPRVPLTVNEVVLAHLDFAKTYYVRDGQPTREVINIKYAVTPLVELYGSLCVDEFGPVALKAVRHRPAAARSLADGYAAMAASARARGMGDQAAMYEQASRAIAETTTGSSISTPQ